jgi:hypothetical protein
MPTLSPKPHSITLIGRPCASNGAHATGHGFAGLPLNCLHFRPPQKLVNTRTSLAEAPTLAATTSPQAEHLSQRVKFGTVLCR